MFQSFYILEVIEVSVSQSDYFAPKQTKPRDILMGIIPDVYVRRLIHQKVLKLLKEYLRKAGLL